MFCDTPTEIVSRVFEFWTVVPDKNSTGFPTLPFELGKVCTSWRQIAWSTPTLWNHISFSFYKKNLLHRIELLEEIIPRSQAALLTIRLYDPGLEFFGDNNKPPQSFKSSEHLQRLIQCLYDCSNRWFNIELEMWDMSYLLPLFQRLPRAPNLRSIRFSWLAIDDGSPNVDIDFTTLGPNIRVFHLGYHPNFSSLSICWDKLLDFSLSASIREALIVLQKTTSLQYFSVINHEENAEQDLPQFSFIHHSLQSVYIENARHAIPFFDRITAPNLQVLKLSSLGLEGIRLASALERSQCCATLRLLELYNVAIESEGIPAILGVLPSLTVLSLSYGYTIGTAAGFCEKVFRTVRGEHAQLPKLRKFCLKAMSDGAEDFQFLTQAFSHIGKYTMPLCEFDLSMETYGRLAPGVEVKSISLDEGLLKQIRELRDEGRIIRVVMHHGFPDMVHDLAPVTNVLI